MATTSYMTGRKKYARPQAMLWSVNPPTLVNGKYIPTGYEMVSDTTGLTSTQLEDQFLILSDHNRSEINISNQRIEQRQRMVNGTMRAYHIADKINVSTSWNMLPSRGFPVLANFNQATGKPSNISNIDPLTGLAKVLPNDLPPYDTPFPTTVPPENYTVDGGAGGAELLKWYEEHIEPFWVFLSYDKYTNFGINTAAHQRLAEYSQVVQMYFSNFDYSVVKRGSKNFDLWNVNVTLEEV